MKTLYDKLWDEHHIHSFDNGYSLIYIDRHLIHEVTSPQAFEGLKQAGRNIWSKKSIMAVPDHNVPTKMRENGITLSLDFFVYCLLGVLHNSGSGMKNYIMKITKMI